MKKLSTLLMFSALVFSQLSVADEVKQTYHQQTINANRVYADGQHYGDRVVLLLHGTLTHNARSTYADLQNNLAKLGISSLAMNLSLGLNDRHGEYDCATPHTHKHTDALGEIQAWMDWLKQQGVNKVTIMGHSRGGNQIAWYASEKDNSMIDKVVLLAPATAAQQSAEDYQAHYHKPLAPILKQAQDLVKAGKGNEMIKADFIYCNDAQVSADAFANYYTVKPQFDTPTLLKSAKKPTLLIIGSEDQVVPDLPERMKKLKNLSKVTVTTIDGGDHFFVDMANEDVAEVVNQFMK